LDEIRQATIDLRPPCATHLGAYGEMARLKDDWLVPLPSSMSAREAMAIGPAGGGGSVAIAILAKRGFSVSALTGGRHGPAQFGRPVHFVRGVSLRHRFRHMFD
jgi:hypothetical protein